MSLYGLDILEGNDGQRYVLEVSGLNVGMKGFRQIYGDTRVETKVWDMLREEHGTIYVDKGTFHLKQWKREHPFRTALGWLYRKLIWDRLPYRPHPVLLSEKGYREWTVGFLQKNVKDLETQGPRRLPFPDYDPPPGGEYCTLFNLANGSPYLDHLPTVNPPVAQVVAQNKLFQDRVLRSQGLEDHLLAVAPVGLGFGRKKEVEDVIGDAEQFILKPMNGMQGFGVKLCSLDALDSPIFHHQGPAYHRFPRLLFGSQPVYVEDMIERKDGNFEVGLALVQRYLDTAVEGKHRSIRAIICNGKFVDAYVRVDEDPVVNLSQTARPERFDAGDLPGFCESVIEKYEAATASLAIETYWQDLWHSFIAERPPITELDRRWDSNELLIRQMGDVMTLIGKMD